MPFAKQSTNSHGKRGLPPSRRLPITYQTLCCRWIPVNFIERCYSRLGPRFTVRAIDMPPLVFVTNPNDIREVLAGDSTYLHPGAGSAVITPLIGSRSFMLLEEDEHLCRRKTITPAFHQRMITHHANLLTAAVEREVPSWPLNTIVPLDPYIRALTLRVILRAIFGDKQETLAVLHDRLTNMLTVTTSIVLQEPKVCHIPGWRKTWNVFRRHRAEVDDLIYGLIHARRAETDHDQTSLLGMLLTAENADGRAMSDGEIRDDLMSMILAGHETTTGELSWAFQLLAHHPETQSCLREEIDMGTEDAYLTAVVQETMRHKPVFLFAIPREVVAPIEIGGWTYEPPAHLVACTYLMHHDPALYPEPYQFRPERFLDGAPGPRTWLPWGGGRKHCLGRHFALLEVQTILREALSTRIVFPASKRIEHPRWRSAILVPHAGCRVIMRERQRSSSRSSGSRSNVSIPT